MINSQKFKKAAKILWSSKATIYGQVATQDGVFDDTTEQVIVENEPCKVIVNTIKSDSMNMVNEQTYDAKLLIRNGIKIPSGAKIAVMDVNGQTNNYKQATQGYTGYANHQEVTMLYDEKAKQKG